MLMGSLTAIRNIASKQVFILLSTGPDGKMTIVNPKGQVLTVPPGLFEPPFSLSSDRFEEVLSQQQIQAAAKHRSGSGSKKTAASSGKSSSRSKSASSVKPKLGVVSSWECDKDALTFYKHQIEPLHPSSSFRITIHDLGQFEITKEAFEREFNEVIIAKSYWSEGHYAYTGVPEKALKYIKA